MQVQLKILVYYLVSITIFLLYFGTCVLYNNNIYSTLIYRLVHDMFQPLQVIIGCSIFILNV